MDDYEQAKLIYEALRYSAPQAGHYQEARERHEKAVVVAHENLMRLAQEKTA